MVAAVDVAAVVTEVAEAAAVVATSKMEITIITMGAVVVAMVEAAMDEDMVEAAVAAVMTIIMDGDVDNTPTMAMAMGVIIEMSMKRTASKMTSTRPKQWYLTREETTTVMDNSKIKARPRDPLEDEAARMAVVSDVLVGETHYPRERRFYKCVKCLYE